MIIVAGTIRFDQSKRQQAAAVAEKACAATRAEPGNQAYRFAVDLTDDSVIHVFEQWESEEALEEHFRAPHLAEMMSAFGDLGVTDVSLTRHEVSGSAPLM